MLEHLNNNTTDYLLCAEHCSEFFTHIMSFDPHNSPIGQVILSPFYRKEN